MSCGDGGALVMITNEKTNQQQHKQPIQLLSFLFILFFFILNIL